MVCGHANLVPETTATSTDAGIPPCPSINRTNSPKLFPGVLIGQQLANSKYYLIREKFILGVKGKFPSTSISAQSKPYKHRTPASSACNVMSQKQLNGIGKIL